MENMDMKEENKSHLQVNDIRMKFKGINHAILARLMSKYSQKRPVYHENDHKELNKSLIPMRQQAFSPVHKSN